MMCIITHTSLVNASDVCHAMIHTKQGILWLSGIFKRLNWTEPLKEPPNIMEEAKTIIIFWSPAGFYFIQEFKEVYLMIPPSVFPDNKIPLRNWMTQNHLMNFHG